MRRLILFFSFALIFVASNAQKSKATLDSSGISYTTSIQKNLSDEQLLDLVQKQTLRYFWNFAHPVSYMARERSNEAFNYGNEVVTTGGTGFGVMAIIVGVDRHWIPRDSAVHRLLKMLHFLSKADSYHGAFPHWLNGETGKTIPFGRKDDGADLVETSYLFEGLLCARQYFNDTTSRSETALRNMINSLWNDVEWNWFTRDGQEVLYWHWSPNNGWAMNLPVRGFNECLITYVLAASAERYPVSAAVYHHGWVQSDYFKNGKQFFGYTLPLGFDYGGPLFYTHYSFLGLDPHGLKDKYADYWEQNENHTQINYTYCVKNPKGYKGYGANCWGLTSSDNYEGYNAHSPTNDLGVITPSAALSAFPYTPDYSMAALKHFYFDMGNKTWNQYGFVDAFSESKDWYANSDIAIDEGPIVGMIENYRTGLLWKLFMSCDEVKGGLKKLGFTSPYLK